MLTKTKENETANESSVVNSKEGITVIGRQVSIEGSIFGKENLVIDGNLKGTIELEGHQVTIGTQGRVEGEIHADNITISGQVVGNVKAKNKVEITKDANLYGEIKAKRISVEEGAYIKTVIELEGARKKNADTSSS